MQYKADLLLITVNKFETQAVFRAFEAETGEVAEPISIENRVYRDLGTVNGTRVFHALSEMASGGLGASHATTMKAISALHPSAVIAVGIAFGMKPLTQKIGEILVSRQLALYELQRIGSPKVVFRGDKPHASPWLLNYFEGISQTTWNGPDIHSGVVLSGEKLIDNEDFREQLSSLAPEAIGGEMEGAGLYAASQEEKVDWIVIKAICDWADGLKNEGKEERQRVAASNAADFLLHALTKVRLVGGKAPTRQTNSAVAENKTRESSHISTRPFDNVKLKRKFSDSDRDEFLDGAFEFAADFFQQSLTSLKAAQPSIDTKFRRIDSNCFTCVIYQDGAAVSRCKIKLGGSIGKGISYSHNDSPLNESINEEIWVTNDEYNLYLSALGMPSLDSRNVKALTQKSAAQYLWDIFFKPLK